jgi:hypothetical protein
MDTNPTVSSQQMKTWGNSIPADQVPAERDLDNNAQQAVPSVVQISARVSAEMDINQAVSTQTTVPDPLGNGGSPLQIDKVIQKQGEDLHQLLQMLLQSVEPHVKEVNQKVQRKSPRLGEKAPKGKNILKKAQDMIANKSGGIEEDKELDNRNLQQYVDLYKQPLIEESMEVIRKLTEVSEDLMKKKKKEKKKKSEDKGIMDKAAEAKSGKKKNAGKESKKKGKKSSGVHVASD